MDLVTCGFIRWMLRPPLPPEGVPAARMIAALHEINVKCVCPDAQHSPNEIRFFWDFRGFCESLFPISVITGVIAGIDIAQFAKIGQIFLEPIVP
ncbi:hypothetical protein DN752_18415 [Echinicola strongylocentroti]|uniref:Uncharacterized protein n=1 Tax=Echinicola strongylocentroti TaxID=1795355 RepID=A0A2Z4INQ4_9BACT|nr:hypothetical protein DN752_18415 [Echinicola strongylocentroti]